MVRLMYVSHQNRWVDLSLRNIIGDWLRRIEERFAGVNGGGQIPSIIQSFTSLDHPHASVKEFFEKYPTGTTRLVSAEGNG
jgi:fatty acid synthase subunit alpha